MKDRRFIIGLAIVALLFVIVYLFYGINLSMLDYALSLRIPRVIALVLTAITIGYSTVVFQTITNNRILTPSIMGLDSLYIFLQTTIIFVLGSSHFLIQNQIVNFILATSLMVLSSVILYKVVFRRNQSNILFLLLFGTVLASFFRSISSFMQMVIDPNEFGIIQNKLFASFNNINTSLILLACMVIVLIVPFIYDDIKLYDVIALGRDHAINLGVNYDRFIYKSLIIVALLTAVATALVGPIAFLGLLVVNLSREQLKGYHHKQLLLASSLLGIVTLVGGQFIIEKLLHYNTPLSVVINFIGGLYFIILLLKENKA